MKPLQFPSYFPFDCHHDISFQTNGHLVLMDIWLIPHSYISFLCIHHLGLVSSGVVVDGAVSVNIRNSWATCIVSLLSSPSECVNLDTVLSWDWHGHLKGLCTVTGTSFSMELVDHLCFVPVADLFIPSAMFHAS